MFVPAIEVFTFSIAVSGLELNKINREIAESNMDQEVKAFLLRMLEEKEMAVDNGLNSEFGWVEPRSPEPKTPKPPTVANFSDCQTFSKDSLGCGVKKARL